MNSAKSKWNSHPFEHEKSKIVNHCQMAKPQNFSDIFSRIADFAEKLYSERRMREKFFSKSLFGEPAWDILLDVYLATIKNKNISISSACLGANVPPTTALRWISVMENHDIITRCDDPDDNRRSFVRLTPNAYHQMTNFLFAALSKSENIPCR